MTLCQFASLFHLKFNNVFTYVAHLFFMCIILRLPCCPIRIPFLSLSLVASPDLPLCRVENFSFKLR